MQGASQELPVIPVIETQDLSVSLPEIRRLQTSIAEVLRDQNVRDYLKQEHSLEQDRWVAERRTITDLQISPRLAQPPPATP